MRMRTLGIALAGFVICADPAVAQSVPAVQAPADDTRVGDVVVIGSPLEAQAEAFVASVGAPPRGRKLATWSERICVGAAGLAAEPARAMVDRVLDWAVNLGLRVGSPGCDPTILIVFSDDGDRTAAELVRGRPRDFDPGVSSSHRGERALREFQTSGRLVRWWHLSLPIDPDTGASLVRLRNQLPFSGPPVVSNPAELGDYGQITLGARLYDDSLDALQSVVIVVDVAAFDHADFAQLSDYVAMVALAQIDPATRPGVPSILNLFNPETAQERTVSQWDQMYLQALYGTTQRNLRPQSDDGLIARVLARKLREDAQSESGQTR